MARSGDPVGMANLIPAELGNDRAVTHGAHSERLVGPVASDIAEEVEALCSGTPAGEPQFSAARALLARKLARLRMVGEYVEANHNGSPLTHKGGVLKAAQFELTLLASVEKTLGDLGLNPSAAANPRQRIGWCRLGGSRGVSWSGCGQHHRDSRAWAKDLGCEQIDAPR